MNIENIKPAKEDFVVLKKKTIIMLAILIILGLLTGLILSNFFINEANKKIDDYNENMKKWYQNWNNSSFNNSSYSINHSDSVWNSGSNLYLKKLNYFDVIMLSIGIINICIAIYLLIGIIITYFAIFFKSKSPFIIGLIFVFIPLLIILLFLLNTLHALYFSSALNYSILGSALGFGVEGLGAIISIVSFFMILGFSILFYLTNE